MKKLITMLILILSFSGFSQVRPPVVTNTLNTNNFIWESDTIFKDTLNYFWQISPTCYKIRHLDVSTWSGPFCFDTQYSDSLNLEWNDTWIRPGDTIFQDNALFHFRPKPDCPGCWQYSGVTSNSWNDFVCEETGHSNLNILKHSKDVLRINYHENEWEDSIGFRFLPADSGKVPMIVGDSMKWMPILIDSIYDENQKRTLNRVDTIRDQRDSIYYEKWLKSGDTLNISVLDSFFVVPDSIWVTKNDILDTYWKGHQNGIYYYPSGNSRVGLGMQPTQSYQLNIASTSSGTAGGIFVDAEQTGLDVHAYENNFHGILRTENLYNGGLCYPSWSGDSAQYIGFVNDSTLDWFDIPISGRDTITINGIRYTNGGVCTINTDDADHDPLNEKDSLQINGNWYSNGESVTLSDADERVKMFYYPNSYSDAGYLNEDWFEGMVSNYRLTWKPKSDTIIINGQELTNGSSMNIPEYWHVMTPLESHYITSREIMLADYENTGYGHASSTDYSIKSSSNSTLVNSAELEFNANGHTTFKIARNGIEVPLANSYIGFDDYKFTTENTNNLQLKWGASKTILQYWEPDNTLILYDKLKIGDGATITRSGTMAGYDFWFGTQAEWTANTPHNGIYPQSTTTIWHIKD
jgi:hypothetical protein